MAFIKMDQFTHSQAKPLPIFLLLDTSGSMNIVTNPDEVRRTGKYDVVDGNRVEYVEGGKTRISVLNESVGKMLRTLARYERDETEFLIGIITFGADTRLIMPLSPASDIRASDLELEANGNTPLGEALRIAKQIIEDKGQVPSRSFRPLVILVSDGQPDDGWQSIFQDFIQNGRTSKCDRMALAISNEADRDMLGKFVEGSGHTVFEADTADQITSFFKFVTMSTVQRTQSQNPNEVPKDASVVQPPLPPPASPGNPKTPSEPQSVFDDDGGYW